MFTESEFSIFDFASCISEAIDLVFPALNDHHKKVAYIAYNLAKEMGLPDDDVKDTVLASILHDIGAFTIAERALIASSMFDDSELDEHATMGYRFLCDFEPLSKAAEIIKHHHEHYNTTSADIPIGSYILHLADRLAVLLNDSTEVLEQIPGLMKSIADNSAIFHPATVAALSRLEKLEYFWIEACSLSIYNALPERMKYTRKMIDLDTLRGFAKVVSQIIDYRSRFTSTHSSGVAAVALEITTIYGFSERECKMMEIAGFLHDLGKLAISNDILEKNGALTDEEFNEMRKHTYYTYVVLNKIRGLEHISTWAAYHHEKLNGNGYPFHIKGEDFSLLAKIMAVADIVTAITEDRPYRHGMQSDKAMKVLTGMVESGAIDKGVVGVVTANFERINDVRARAQMSALQEYIAFREDSCSI